MSNDKKHNRPKYSLEFKQDATKLVLEKGYSQQQAADHLGISLSALARWVRAERKPSKPDSTEKKSNLNLADHDELIRLRKENEQLRMEREILKKAAVFFAKETE
jgi:transposase